MSHLDEGTLHAMLDGELEQKEVAEIQAHVSSCTSCGLRLREVREFLDEADRLIASVEMDGAAAAAPVRRPDPPAPEAAQLEPPRAEPPRAQPPRVEPTRSEPGASGPARPELVRPESTPRAEPSRPPVPARPQPRPVPERPVNIEAWNAPPPPLLMPDNESPADRRMRRMRKYGWAAMILVFISAGVIGVRTREAAPMFDALRAREATPEPVVVSPEESTRPEAPATTDSARSDIASKSPAKVSPAAKPPAAAPRDAAKDGGAAGGTASGNALALTRQADSQPKADAAKADAAKAAAAEAAAAEPDTQAESPAAADEAEVDSSDTGDLADVRERASEALADLDRERRRNEAAAATAALDARRRAAQTAPATGLPRAARVAAPTPPTPPTLEQRAQVYLRIGLDEAARQLGGPAHVIEGMSAMFMGLAQGVVVPGADATRPVVRVVYQDSQGRLIMLDQQRLRPGQPVPQGSPLGWVMGETAIWLHGEAASEVLRLYRPRVR